MYIVFSIFPSAVSAATPVASYGFNEGTGNTVTDASGAGNTGSFLGPTWTLTGKFGGALTFDGTDDLVSVPDTSSLDLTNGMTVSAWVRPTSISGWRTVVMKQRSNNLSYALYANNNQNRPLAEVSISNNARTTAGTAQLPLNTWSHVAITYNGTALKVFLNGTQVATKNYSGSIQTSNNPLQIGGNSVWGEYFKGDIDEVRVYTTALTQTEVQADMNTPISSGANPTVTPTPGTSQTPTPTTTITPTRTPTPTPTPTGTGDTRAEKGEWTNHMNWPIVAVHATLLPNGKVLLWDGWELASDTRVWDPQTNAFASRIVEAGLFCSAHSFLANGRLLVAGGWQANGDGIVDTHAFDATTQTWSKLPDMAYKRWYPTTITLNDGRVLALSGQISSDVWADKPEVYDPVTNKWTVINIDTSNMHDLEYPYIFKKSDGKMYVVSPYTGKLFNLDVTTPSWTSAGTSPIQYGSLTQYAPGKILMTGGGPNYSQAATGNAAVIDITQPNPSWRSVSGMEHGRFMHSLVPLPDGTVFAVGGSSTVYLGATDGVKEAELWNPETESWKKAAVMQDSRMYHSTAMLLPDGRVLVAGGGRYGNTPDMLTADLYNPPYLYKGNRPTITSISSTVQYNEPITIVSPDTAGISKVVMISLPSVTHTVDMNQYVSPVAFTKNGTTITATAPSNAHYAPPGFYMVFIINSSGVPSVAKIIQLSGSEVPPTVTPTNDTPTPNPTGLITPTPTGSPSAAQTITFNDHPSQNQVLSGQYPTGVINWGTNTWFISPPWRSFTTKSISFTTDSQTSASFSFVSPKKLTVIDVFNGGTTTTVTLKCSGQSDKVAAVSPGQLLTIPTGWNGTCTTVTIQSTNGWDTNYDNLVIE